MSDEAFAAALPAALAAVADEDADGDGHGNRAELAAGTDPADAGSVPGGQGPTRCARSTNPRWDVCGYDAEYAWRKLNLDVCGQQPDYALLQTFRGLDTAGQDQALSESLVSCLASEFWRGRDGVLWRLAHAKIRPLQAIKAGRGAGPVPLADYDHDYALFAYTQSGERDARDVLLADYHVRVSAGAPTTYTQVDTLAGQQTPAGRRNGMLTTRWFFVINTMFTAVPRTTAAQAYRAYLGLDIAHSEGLVAPDAPLVDYDDKGITAPACAACHETLDPLSYPFSRYWGIAGGLTAAYDPSRMQRFGAEEGARIQEVPEAGHLFGQPVADLNAWARVAADSDAFAQATVRDYWRILVGHDPLPQEEDEFEALWRAFGPEHGYRVERMLQALVRTEAYGVP
ncbi:MAG: hypothetical protein H6702_14920 [Myxococcales bacterium]|nr:hypothetical protein [Myxococcales bacterium]